MKRRRDQPIRTWNPPRLLRPAFSFIFPSAPACPLCAKPHVNWFAGYFRPFPCERCMADVHELTRSLCRVCGKSVSGGVCADCRRQPHLFLVARAFARYDGAVEKAIKAFKYQGEVALAPLLGEWLAEGFLRHFGWDNSALLVPVPMHPVKEHRRGYNQAALLATVAAKHVRLPVVHALTRLTAHDSQTIHSRTERLNSLRGAFALAEQPQSVSGRSVILVDDVLTTGGTADACAEVLIEGQAASVYVLTVAR